MSDVPFRTVDRIADELLRDSPQLYELGRHSAIPLSRDTARDIVRSVLAGARRVF